MPPRLRQHAQSVQSSASRISDIFLCPSCSQWRLSARPLSAASRRSDLPILSQSKPLQLKGHIERRSRPCFQATGLRDERYQARATRRISTSAATSIINAPDPIPARLKDLYKALESLKTEAAQHINLSQLPLILRGLESSDGGVTRVAVLAFGAPQDTARKLARMLLADPLGDKARWEDLVQETSSLGDGKEAQSGAVLLKYGEEDMSGVEPQRASPLYREILVPSSLLQNHNIEILVSGLSTGAPVAAGQQQVESPSDLILVPSLDGGSAGVVTMVRYPVHKALVVGDGPASCFHYGTFMGGEDIGGVQREMIRFTANVTDGLPEMTADKAKGELLTFTNVDRAAKALAVFREDVKNATQFEDGWLHSGMPVLRSWLVANVPISGSSGHGTVLKPALRNLITHLLAKASTSMNVEAAKQQTATLQTGSPATTLDPLVEALEEWSGKAHEELRDELEKAFQGDSWSRISWFKLFWRVDDVSMVTQDMIEHQWLLGAEKGCYWLIGRFESAGLLDNGTIAKVSDLAKQLAEAHAIQGPETVMEQSDSNANQAVMIASEDTRLVPFTGIGQARALRVRTDGAELQSKAHHLLLQSLSTFSLTSGLSALLYFSTSFSVFDAASVAAFGLVWSLRHIQRSWEKERDKFAKTLKEEGRLVLKRIEDGFLEIISEAREKRGGEGPDEEARRRAREAVNKAQDELKKVNG